MAPLKRLLFSSIVTCLFLLSSTHVALCENQANEQPEQPTESASQPAEELSVTQLASEEIAALKKTIESMKARQIALSARNLRLEAENQKLAQRQQALTQSHQKQLTVVQNKEFQQQSRILDLLGQLSSAHAELQTLKTSFDDLKRKWVMIRADEKKRVIQLHALLAPSPEKKATVRKAPEPTNTSISLINE